ncbi:MAG: hypothetical protein AAGD86_13540, partial [Pseudomonadota bacterium]
MKILLGLVLLLLATSLGSPTREATQGEAAERSAAPIARFGAAELIGKIEKKSLNEASGMAASRTDDGVLWLINDSGHKPKLFAMAPDGTHLGTVDVDGANNRDWEDLASFSLDGRHWLLIADTGDNKSRHPVSALVVVPEPRPEADGRYDGS